MMKLKCVWPVVVVIGAFTWNSMNAQSLNILQSSRTIGVNGSIQTPSPPPLSYNSGDSSSASGAYDQSVARGLSVGSPYGSVSSSATQTSTVASARIDYASTVSSSASFGSISSLMFSYQSSASSGMRVIFSVTNEVDYRIDLGYRFVGSHSCYCSFPVHWNFSLRSSASGDISGILISTDPGGTNSFLTTATNFVLKGIFKPGEFYTLVFTQRNDSLAITDTENGTITGTLALQLLPGPRLTARASQTELCYDTLANLYYQVQYRSTLTANNWLPLSPGFLRGTGGIVCTNDAILPSQPQRYYRVIRMSSPPP
jgi:hypothetical protein